MDAPSPGPVEASAVAASKAQILREASDALIDAGMVISLHLTSLAQRLESRCSIHRVQLFFGSHRVTLPDCCF